MDGAQISPTEGRFVTPSREGSPDGAGHSRSCLPTVRSSAVAKPPAGVPFTVGWRAGSSTVVIGDFRQRRVATHNANRRSTDDRRDDEPARLREKIPEADLLRDMVGFPAQQPMELETGGLTGAGYGKKNPQRLAQRNGCRDRHWETWTGAVVPRISRRRSAGYFALPPGGRAGWLRRRSPPSCRRPTSRVSRPARSTIWSRPWA
jgi:hypothetical protein